MCTLTIKNIISDVLHSLDEFLIFLNELPLQNSMKPRPSVLSELLLEPFDSIHDLIVHDEHDGGTSSTKDIGKSTLEKPLGAFIL